MRRTLAVLLALCFMALSGKGQEKKFNPDGYCGHPSVSIDWSYFSQQNVYYYNMFDPVANITFYDTTKQSANSYGGDICLPLSNRITLVIEDNFTHFNSTKTNLYTIGGGVIYYGSTVKNLADFINPDGKIYSFILFPVMGLHIYNQKTWYGSTTKTGFLAGLQVSYVVSKNITVRASYLLDEIEASKSHEYLIGCSIHLNSKAPDSDRFNPDGRPGSITLSPNIGYAYYNEHTSGILAGINAAVPISNKISLNAVFQYEKQREEQFTSFRHLENSNTYSSVIGLTFHF